MVFFLNYLYSVIWAYCVGKHYVNQKLSTGAFFVLLFPVFSVWLFLCGGQYGVGTDYWSYLSLFNGNDLNGIWVKGEYVFGGIILLFNSLGLHGQILFYVFYAINFLFLILVFKRFPLKLTFLLIILYITVTSLFNNQLNTLRQATAIYIGTYVAILMLENKSWKAFGFILVAMLVHQSALILFIFYGFNYFIRKISYYYLLVFLIVAIVLSITLNTDLLVFALSFLS